MSGAPPTATPPPGAPKSPVVRARGVDAGPTTIELSQVSRAMLHRDTGTPIWKGLPPLDFLPHRGRYDRLATYPFIPCRSSSRRSQAGSIGTSRLRSSSSGSLEDRKEFVRAFVAGVRVVSGDARLNVQMRSLPALASLRPGNSACRMVAGARYEPVQIEMRPMPRFLAGLQRVA